MRDRIAALVTNQLYRHDVIGDVPRSHAYYAFRYGSAQKLLNYVRVKQDYRAQRTTVRGYPYTLRIEPISACNLRCPLCPTGTGEIDRKKMVMPPETLDKILTECGRYVLFAHLWIWGEPLLNKNLDELAAVCHRHGIGSEVSSHFSVPLDNDRIDNLIRSGLDWLIISNDAASAESYSQYRIGGNYDQVIRNMKAFVARKRALGSKTPFLEWQFVPFRHNEHEMEEAKRLAAEIGVDGLRFKPSRLDKTKNLTFQGLVPIDLTNKWAPENSALVHVPLPETDSYLDYHCTFLWGSMSLYGDGAVAPCCETSMTRDDLGNLFKQDFREIWNGPTYVKARRVALGLADTAEEKSMACYGCKVFSKPHSKPAPSVAMQRGAGA